MQQDLTELINKVKPFLRQYLQHTGVKIRGDGHFICPSPEQHDTDPSAHFVPGSNDTVAYCFGCKTSMDVFTVANWREGLPLRGPEFIHKTVYGLAKRFGIPFDATKMSERTYEILNLRQIYSDAYEALRGFWENRKFVQERGWPEHLCYTMGVATVTSWDQFIQYLQSIRKYSKSELKHAGIRPQYFNPEAITFTIFDDYGDPVGFAARDTRYSKESKSPKYINTHANLVYNKSRIVYGLHRARQETGPTVVVEGYADVMTAYTYGLYNTVAVCSAKPTAEQIAALEEAGKRDLVIALDYDVKPGPDGRPTGQGRTEDFLDEYVRNRRSVRLRVLDWKAVSPNGKLDMDAYLQSLGRKGMQAEEVRRAWYNVPKVEGFDWRMSQIPSEQPPDEVVQQMIPIIAAEPVHAKQEALLTRLGDRTGIRRAALERDLDAALDLKHRKVRDQVQHVTSKIAKDMRLATPEEAEQILQDAHTKVRSIVEGSRTSLDIGTSLERTVEILDTFAKTAPPDGMVGLKTSFPVFDKHMNGLCNGLWIFGGFASAGKTSTCAQLSWNALMLNQDAIVLVMTLDDSLEEFLAKYMAMITGFPIRKVVSPGEDILSNPKAKAIYDAAREQITTMISRGRLEVRDAGMGTTTNHLERWVDQVRKRNPDKRIAVWLDNFHCLTDRDVSKNEEVRLKRMCKRIKTLADTHRCFIGMTVELGKNEERQRPTLKGLKGTGSFEYDAKGVILVHNPLQTNRESPEFWTDKNISDPHKAKKPYLFWYVDKNKNLYGVWLGRARIMFDPECCRMQEVSDDQDMYYRQERRQNTGQERKWD